MTQLPGETVSIARDPELASRKAFDVVVIGGGIYGVMVLLEATRRRMKALLIEKEDFGSGTTFNWLRILHGGFRYLQKIDLLRFFESVAERSWFLRTFPSLSQPLPCLMPLYGKGLRRPSVLRVAVFVNDLLSIHRNRGLREGKRIPGGRIISRRETLERAPGIRTEGLKGAVMWYDAFLPESPILMKEILRWCVGQGAMVLNYTGAKSLIVRHGQVNGIEAEDLHSKKRLQFHAHTVVNAAGPWCRELAVAFDRDRPELFAYSKAWNVLFDCAAPAKAGLAVAPDVPDARTYFLIPWKGRLMAGTGHAFGASPEQRGKPTTEEMNRFISDLNSAVPGLRLRRSDVRRIFHGHLPAVHEGSDELSDRAVLLDHEQHGGPRGLLSVSGVKFTTARRVAEKTIKRLFPDSPTAISFDHRTLDEAIRASMKRSLFTLNGGRSGENPSIQLENLKDIMRSESVVHLHDLVFRRTNLWEEPGLALKISAEVGQTLKMEQGYLTEEMQLIKRYLESEILC